MKLKPLFTTALTLGLLASSAHATIIDYQSGTRYEALHILDSSTGTSLHGMDVTVCFLNESCQTVGFDGTLGEDGYGAAIGDGWQLSLGGDSFITPFLFSSSVEVTLLHLNGAPGNAVFDTKPFDDYTPGTPGADLGSYFSDVVGLQPERVVYSNEVWFNQTFYGDLYTSMSIYFDPAGVSGSMSFYTDTDQARGLQVPAPATLLLMLAGLAALRQRKSRT